MAYKIALLALALVCLVHQNVAIVYPTLTFDGWDVIFLDSPSYLFSIQHSYSHEQLYIFGGDRLRVATTANNFTVQDHNSAIEWNQQFVSLHVFHNGTDLWAIGPTNPNDYSAHPDGYDLPIALTGPLWHTQNVPGLQGFILYSVHVDASNFNDILSYMVGWIPVTGQNNETVNQVALGVVRLHVNLNAPYAQRQFSFDPVADVLPLAYNVFSIYGPHHKPQLHYNNVSNILIVVDPGTDYIFTVQTGPGQTPMTKTQATLVKKVGYSITSSLFHLDTNLLYVGFAAAGIGNGTIVSYSMAATVPQHSIQLNGTLANPRAISIDEPSDTLYVGFNGGDAVLKLDYLLNIQGWQRVPDYLTRLEAARVGADHVYFITNEQHSKVVRVNKKDFCPHLCPHFGYCENGKCKCGGLFSKLSSDGRRCEPAKGKSDKGAATALGVLFALTFVAAVLGWVLWWRQRKGGYVNV